MSLEDLCICLIRSWRVGGTSPTDSFDGANLRVLQWNLLAEGLVPEGFLMPLGLARPSRSRA